MEKELNVIWDFAKRHTTAIIIIAVCILGLILLTDFKTDKQTQLNTIYSEMQVKENNITAAIDAKFIGTETPSDFIAYEKDKAIKSLQSTPEYRGLQSEAQKLEDSKNSVSIYPFLLLGLLGMIIVPFMSGISLFITTKINFVEKLLSGDNDVYGLIKTILISYSLVYITVMIVYGLTFFK